jgi:acyl carrier protein
MDKNSILPEINKLFNQVMDNESIKLNFETTANDVAEWDSLTNIQFLLDVEKRFKIRFSSSEIGTFKNIGELCDNVMNKISQ